MAGYYFPTSYQPNYYGGMYNPQPNIPQVPTPAQQQTGGGLTWVQGEAGAKSYLVAPNTTVLLMDSESNKFYLKSSDVSGMPQPLRVFEYTEKTGQQAQKHAPDVDLGEYVTKREFDEFKTTLKSSFGIAKEKVSKEAKYE